MLNDEFSIMENIRQRLVQVRSHLSENDFPALENIPAWYSFLTELKIIQGNFNNDVSFLATLLAKQYLKEKYGLQHFNAADKPQGAPGLDINVTLSNGKRLVAEIKTTIPYKPDDLGAQQITSFKKDFKKLVEVKADIKLFLLTEYKTYELMKESKYKSQLSGIKVVLLPTGEEFSA